MTEESGRQIECKIYATRETEESCADEKAGKVRKEGKRLLVATGDKWIEICALQPAGKKRMESDAFLLGYHPVMME